MQDTLSSRALGLADAFRPSARASKGILHTKVFIFHQVQKINRLQWECPPRHPYEPLYSMGDNVNP